MHFTEGRASDVLPSKCFIELRSAAVYSRLFRFNKYVNSFYQSGMELISNLDAKIDLNDMPYACGAGYYGISGCLPGTRMDIVDHLISWVNKTLPDPSLNDCRILLLTGAAGSGKTAVATTVANTLMRFTGLVQLSASVGRNKIREIRRISLAL